MKGKWEGSKADKKDDKAQAKKRGWGMTKWENSKADAKRDMKKGKKR